VILFWALIGYSLYLQIKVLQQANQYLENGVEKYTVLVNENPPTVALEDGSVNEYIFTPKFLLFQKMA